MNGKHRLESWRSTALWGARIRMAIAMVAVALVPSCGQAVRTGQASSFLILTSLTGASGASTVESDVITIVGGVPTILTDIGQASFQLALKDETSGLTPSVANSITITQYHVTYTRSDGHNVQGVDVPFAFDGAVTATVSGTSTVGFTLVRNQAKDEAPLKALGNCSLAVPVSPCAAPITTIAEVTFFGHDQTGRDVSVVGRIEVSFANWSDG